MRISSKPPLSGNQHKRWLLWLVGAHTLLLLFHGVPRALCMSTDELRSKRIDTINVFYHGFDNYMVHGFPEDELKPVTCRPLTRDRENPAHIEVNDVLGNYSLTLIDSLSTLAILASSEELKDIGRDPLEDFQNGIQALVELYGDGSMGPQGLGSRNRGFDLDSKVQVFETVIRGVGGLVSAHLFAVGELPIRGYEPYTPIAGKGHRDGDGKDIQWQNGFKYDGQLLRLATDLATRLLPAFHSVTGLPYPRVNLRYGIPFYTNSPLNYDAEHGQCATSQSTPREITETCSAGAGSLVLEFTTLSRLTGDFRFEQAAKTAFWAVWARRSSIDLIGAGIDAESGEWVAPFSGIGAGIDSFFEYALKSHILLSGTAGIQPQNSTTSDNDFLTVWLDAHAGIKRHVFRGSAFQHPHYIQSDLYTGAVRALWIDSLSAFYPGLLALAGELDEAITTHLLYAALWNRYSAMPERWSASTGNIDSGLRWWGGRPEFIESTWYIYQATQDPWYLHVGEMALKDIKRRCWTNCGWAGLEDVRTGELKDRMESFFLGETTKYLYLLFDQDHPLNKLDAPFVFTTEGHPVIIPESTRQSGRKQNELRTSIDLSEISETSTCPNPPALLPLSISQITSRPDFFHAASLARLHQLPRSGVLDSQVVESAYDNLTLADAIELSPTMYNFYPWTMPTNYVPHNGTSSKIVSRITFDLMFNVGKGVPGMLQLERTDRGIVINSMNGIKLGLIQEPDVYHDHRQQDIFRIHAVAQLALGRDEEVYIPTEALAELNPADPYFTKRRELDYVDIVVDDGPSMPQPAQIPPPFTQTFNNTPLQVVTAQVPQNNINLGDGSILSMLMNQFSIALENSQLPFSAMLQGTTQPASVPSTNRPIFPASVATGIGAAPVPEVVDAPLSRDGPPLWSTIYLSDETCTKRLPPSIPRNHQIIVMKRGGCSFSEKLQNIPSFPPSPLSLQLVIVVSFPEHDGDGPYLIRPLLDEMQRTPSGMVRPHAIPLVMVEGGEEMWKTLERARSVGVRRRYWFESQGLRIANLFVV